MEITYFGHSCFLLQYNESRLLIDPGNKENSKIKGNIIYSTHHHWDHTAGITDFLQLNEPYGILIANKQVTKNYSKWEDRVITVKHGEEITQGGWNLKFIEGKHGFFRGVINLGIIVKTPSFSFGHLGDSVSFERFANEKIDMLAVPIGSVFAASPKGAIKELEKFNQLPSAVVPMHWLWRRPKGFCRNLSKKFPQINCIIPKKNKIISY